MLKAVADERITIGPNREPRQLSLGEAVMGPISDGCANRRAWQYCIDNVHLSAEARPHLSSERFRETV
jgi:hypothetical protein